MPHAYTEDQLVGQPAIGLFATLRFEVVIAAGDELSCDRSSMRRISGRMNWKTN